MGNELKLLEILAIIYAILLLKKLKVNVLISRGKIDVIRVPGA